MATRATAEQWFVVLDADGQSVSEGTVVELSAGQTQVEVDGPSDGRPWDEQAQAWGPRPTPPEDPPADPAAAVLPALATIAAAPDTTQDEKVAAIIATLAAAWVDSASTAGALPSANPSSQGRGCLVNVKVA